MSEDEGTPHKGKTLRKGDPVHVRGAKKGKRGFRGRFQGVWGDAFVVWEEVAGRMRTVSPDRVRALRHGRRDK